MCEKKTDRQTEEQNKFENRLSRQAGGGGLIFFVRGGDVYWTCQKIYPQYSIVFIKNKFGDIWVWRENFLKGLKIDFKFEILGILAQNPHK